MFVDYEIYENIVIWDLIIWIGVHSSLCDSRKTSVAFCTVHFPKSNGTNWPNQRQPWAVLKMLCLLPFQLQILSSVVFVSLYNHLLCTYVDKLVQEFQVVHIKGNWSRAQLQQLCRLLIEIIIPSYGPESVYVLVKSQEQNLNELRWSQA